MPVFKKQPCPICGTSKYRKAVEGYYFCKNGHKKMDYQEEEGDEDALIGTRLSARKTVKVNQKVTRLYGEELQDAFIRLVQYALQTMSESFIRDLGFPIEFDYIVRELWLMYVNDSKLTLLDVRISNQTQQQQQSSTHTVEEGTVEDAEQLLNETDSESESDSGADMGMTENESKMKIRQQQPAEWPDLRFRHVLIFCYLTCVYLGWPVMLSDIHRWCTSMKLPYIAILKGVPEDTLRLFDSRSLQSILYLPPTNELQHDAYLYATAFEKRCQLVLPKFNASLLIYRYCTQFFLPVEMYFCAQYMYDHFPQHDRRMKTNSLNYHAIEYQVMVIVLVLVKACYGVDNERADPVYATETDNTSLPPPLPRHIWFNYVRANYERWEHIYRTRLIHSPTVDLDVILDYLKNALPSHRNSVQEKKSLLRHYILRMQRELNRSIRTHVDYDDFMQDLPSSTSSPAPSASSTSLPTMAKVMGSEYKITSGWHLANGKHLYAKEYEWVLGLASRITGIDAQFLHNRLLHYESRLRKLANSF